MRPQHLPKRSIQRQTVHFLQSPAFTCCRLPAIWRRGSAHQSSQTPCFLSSFPVLSPTPRRAAKHPPCTPPRKTHAYLITLLPAERQSLVKSPHMVPYRFPGFYRIKEEGGWPFKEADVDVRKAQGSQPLSPLIKHGTDVRVSPSKGVPSGGGILVGHSDERVKWCRRNRDGR